MLEAKRSMHMSDGRMSDTPMAIDDLEQIPCPNVRSELVTSANGELGGSLEVMQAGHVHKAQGLVSGDEEVATESREERKPVESGNTKAFQSVNLESPVRGLHKEESGNSVSVFLDNVGTDGLPCLLKEVDQAAMIRAKQALRACSEEQFMKQKASNSDKLWSTLADQNLRLLLQLGATNQHLVHIYGRHASLYYEDATPSLLASARLFHEFGLTVSLLVRLIYGWGLSTSRRIMLLSEPLKPRENLIFLRDIVGVSALEPMILACPNVLITSTLKMAQNIVVLDELKVPCTPVIYARYPRLLLMNTETLRNRINSLYDMFAEASISAPDVLQKRPNLCSVSSYTIKENITILTNKFGREGCIDVVHRYPTSLMLNPTNLVHTLGFLEEKVGSGALEEVRVVPLLLGFSLEGRIKPRLRVLQELGGRKLSSILMPTNSEFERRFNVSLPLEMPRKHGWL